AHAFQTPVIVLIDQFLADLVTDTPPLDAAARPVDRCIVADAPADYVRYAAGEGGVSPRALPGGRAMVVVDSDEHTEDGHITEDLAVRVRLQDKRLAKVTGLTAAALPPERYGPPDARVLLVCWGSTYGPCREAVDILAGRGASVAMLHFGQVWPLDAAAVRRAMGLDGGGGAGAPRIVCVEGNATGQFATVLAQAGVCAACERLLRYDGMPFTGEDIAERTPL
ncbi:MAG: 2-oxoacid:acceptor oxidoreductase subunit alpha, partial [Planctomycetes bacterium]|nr:2-oxoacid:acceptor oxidoreductase subunit alpha [Planctomycetota bacterium]